MPRTPVLSILSESERLPLTAAIFGHFVLQVSRARSAVERLTSMSFTETRPPMKSQKWIIRPLSPVGGLTPRGAAAVEPRRMLSWRLLFHLLAVYDLLVFAIAQLTSPLVATEKLDGAPLCQSTIVMLTVAH